MDTVVASINIPEGYNRTLSLKNINFQKSVKYLKEEIGQLINIDCGEIDILHKGLLLDDHLTLSNTVEPNGYVFCFRKPKKYICKDVEPPTEDKKKMVHELFSLTSHVQITVNSRVNILQKILHEYPEFRFNLGAHALIRDSVLFNTVHLPEVIQNLGIYYPIICKAAPFIVDAIKKEIKKASASTNVSEPTTDTTSDDENSLGASSNSERNASDSRNVDHANHNQVSRQQLQSALAFAFGTSHTPSNLGNASNNDPNDSITPTLLRNELQRAIESLRQRPTDMEAENIPSNESDNAMQDEQFSADESGDVIPAHYRGHQFAEQLRTMAQMGFLNYEENLTYLNVTNGNIEHAVNLLMGIMN